jgi:sugar phosphate isomerase/epimerase
MQSQREWSRRAFLALAGAVPFVGRLGAASVSAAAGTIPVGLELYSVRDALKTDPTGTVRAVGKMGYEVVEFYAPYYSWTMEQARDMRKVLDEVGLRCLSTHNSPVSFTPDGIQKAIDLNKTIGSSLLVMASPASVEGADGWKAVADQLNTAADKLKAVGMTAGYHNHGPEWRALDANGQRPMDILAANTHENVVLQLDVGTCVEEKQDPVAWINAHPGRIKSMHCKDFARGGKGYAALFGEGDVQWAAIFKAAEATGGIQCYLIEQEEGPAGDQLARAQQCLANWKKLKG